MFFVEIRANGKVHHKTFLKGKVVTIGKTKIKVTTKQNLERDLKNALCKALGFNQPGGHILNCVNNYGAKDRYNDPHLFVSNVQVDVKEMEHA